MILDAKKKADELFLKFRLLQVSNDDIDDDIFNADSRAKKSLLIALDIVLSDLSFVLSAPAYEFYEKVKFEVLNSK